MPHNLAKIALSIITAFLTGFLGYLSYSNLAKAQNCTAGQTNCAPIQASSTSRIIINATSTSNYTLTSSGTINIVGPTSQVGVRFPDATIQTSASLAGSAANTSAGDFGANTGGGNYSFPANLGIATTTPSTRLVVVANAVLNGLTSGQVFIQGATDPRQRLTFGYDTTNNFGWISAGVQGSTYSNIIIAPAGGNVGIGTTTPAQDFHIFGSAPVFRIQNSGQTPWDIIANISGVHAGGLTISKNGTPQMVIGATGNVGIGTTTPSQNLTVIGNIRAENGSTRALMLYPNTGGANYIFSSGDGTNSYYPLNFRAQGYAFGSAGGNAALFSVLDTGNVGVGTSTPASKLTVVGTVESTTGGFKFPDGTTQTTAAASSGQITSAANVSAGNFGANAGGGNYSFPASVSIGTTTVGRKLDVIGDNTINGGISAGGSTGAHRLNIWSDNSIGHIDSGGTGAVSLAINSAGGNVGIGTTTPASLLTLTGRTQTSFDGVSTYENVASYYNSASALGVGTIAVCINSPTNIMLDAQIDVQGYNGLSEYHVRGYTYTGTAAWHLPAVSYTASGGGSNKQDVRFATGASNSRCILLGQTTTDWGNYLHVTVPRVSVGYPPNAIPGIGNWTISLITDETGLYTNVTTPGVNSATMVFNGNVGIGTTTPATKLVVSGGATVNVATFTNSVTSQSVTFGDASNSAYSDIILQTDSGTGQIFKAGTGYSSYAGTSALNIYNSNGAIGFHPGGVTNAMFIANTTGNVGIGTTTPASKLTVAGTVESTTGGFKFPDGSIQTTAFSSTTESISAANVTAGDFGANYGGGNYSFPANVAIGTTTMTGDLNVAGVSPVLAITDTSAFAANVGGKLSFYNNYSAGVYSSYANIKGIRENAISASNSGALTFETGNNGTPASEKMRITSLGYVAIGTTTPTYAVEVALPSPVLRTKMYGGTAGYAGLMAENDTAGHYIMTLTGGSAMAGTLFGLTRADLGQIYANAIPMVIGTISSQDLYFGTNNTTRMTIKNGGNVGIGTTTPIAPLSISSANPVFSMDRTVNTNLNYLYFTDSGVPLGYIGFSRAAGTGLVTGGSPNSLVFRAESVDTHFADGATIRMTIKSGGNVGIGTTTPASPLTVAGIIESDTGGFKFPDGSIQTTAFSSTTESISAANVSSGDFGANYGGGNYTFPANVGIGTTTAPAANLHVNANAPTVLISNQSNSSTTLVLNYRNTASTGFELTYHTGSAITYFDTQYASTSNQAYGDMAFRTNVNSAPNTLLYLKNNNGNVGIGTTTPSSKLTVVGSVDASAQFLGQAADTVAAPSFSWTGDTNVGIYRPATDEIGLVTNGAERMRIGSTGNVGIGTTTPASPLTVAGIIESDTGGFKFPDGTIQTTAASGATIPATNVSAGIFGANTGGGNYTFTGVLTVSSTIQAQSNITVNTSPYFGKGLVGTYDATKIRLVYSMGSAYMLAADGTGPGNLYGLAYTHTNYTGGGAIAGLGHQLVLMANGVTTAAFGTGIWTNYQFITNATDTVAAPGYTWNADTNMGLYRPAADTLGFVTAGAERMRILSTGQIGVGTTTPTALLSVGTSTTGLVATFGAGSGKINVGTVDPLYTIGGKRYATYLPGMTGQKEETTGNIQCVVSNSQCSYAIDFDRLEEGSDLWLFSKTTNLTKNFSQMTVILTPAFSGNVWYEKDADSRRLVIHASLSTNYKLQATNSLEISYRLTAPRFDANSWSNRATEKEEGFNLDKLLKN